MVTLTAVSFPISITKLDSISYLFPTVMFTLASHLDTVKSAVVALNLYLSSPGYIAVTVLFPAAKSGT